jgi:acid phosphatase
MTKWCRRRALLLTLCAFSFHAQAASLPRPDHIVIVIEENRHFSNIIGNADAPYINALTQRGVLFTRSYAVTHPSQPNYLALFTGSTLGVVNDACPLDHLRGDNLAQSLMDKGLSFAIYSESLPAVGSTGCGYGAYQRKHNPLANWRELAQYNLPFTAFPADYAKLPTVSWVIPDQRNDMHDGTIKMADDWLKQNIEPYAAWALTHNSLLIVTWDEDDFKGDNRIATIMVGQMVKRGASTQLINHYNVLRTITDMYGLPPLNESRGVEPIRDVWVGK